jgi:hypothetical protein
MMIIGQVRGRLETCSLFLRNLLNLIPPNNFSWLFPNSLCRGFRHEKTKKKRGTYRGGNIDLQTHSVKFANSDDE